jgi:hypothetical protein
MAQSLKDSIGENRQGLYTHFHEIITQPPL